MIFAQIELADDALLDELRTINTQSGAQYTPVIREIDPDFEPRSDVEMMLEGLGFEFVEGAPLMFTEVDLRYQINVTVAHKLANSNRSIKRVCMGMCAEAEKAIMRDPTHGKIARDTFLEGGFVQNDGLAEGFYTWSLIFRVRVRYPINQPFQK